MFSFTLPEPTDRDQNMKDFTPEAYKKLAETLKAGGYSFQTFENFLTKPLKKVAIMRHDVDLKKENALQFALLEHELGIQASYFFRIIPESFDAGIIQKIKDLGHEIGYHYEDLTLAGGDTGKAIRLFEEHLDLFRRYYPVKTICMHGSPLSKYDNRQLWQKYDYKKYGLTGEPYFDIDFNEVCYLTDTGRRWDKTGAVVRDKVKSRYNFHFRTTQNIIDHIDELPDKLMINTHPQRWSDKFLPWIKELILQNLKNTIKPFLNR